MEANFLYLKVVGLKKLDFFLLLFEHIEIFINIVSVIIMCVYVGMNMHAWILMCIYVVHVHVYVHVCMCVWV